MRDQDLIVAGIVLFVGLMSLLWFLSIWVHVGAISSAVLRIEKLLQKPPEGPKQP